VLIAHGDATSGYSLYIKNGHLVHDLNIGGGHEIARSQRRLPWGAHRLVVYVERLVRNQPLAKDALTGVSEYTLLIDGEPAGALKTELAFHNLISWSGLDIGRDRGSPMSHFDAPCEFTGKLLRVTVTTHDHQDLDGDSVGDAQMARQSLMHVSIRSVVVPEAAPDVRLNQGEHAPQAAHTLWGASCSSDALPAWHVAI